MEKRSNTASEIARIRSIAIESARNSTIHGKIEFFKATILNTEKISLLF
jgi:hypothetical protein